MPVLEITVLAKLDGVALSGFPIVRRQAVASVVGFDYPQPDTAAAFVSMPTNNDLATLGVLVVRTLDEMVTLRLNGQIDSGLDLDPGGFVIIAGASIGTLVIPNALVRNASGSPTTLQGFGGGT